MADRDFEQHLEGLLACRLCKGMAGRPVSGTIPFSKIIAIGQAPGPHEERLGRPFASTAGKTLFKWLASVGISEAKYRSVVNMSAVCRCYPGKSQGKAGDRIPDSEEIQNCSRYLEFEFLRHKPELVIPMGRLAIQETLKSKASMASVVGTQFRAELFGQSFDCIPLPHPSGLNAWNNMEPGRSLIRKALTLISRHAVVRRDLL